MKRKLFPRNVTTWVGALLAAALLSACPQADTNTRPGQATAPLSKPPAPGAPVAPQNLASRWREHHIPWGSGHRQLGFRAAGHESLAAGPAAVAILASGDPLVLDQLNRRVVRVNPEGSLSEIASVTSDVEDLAVDTDGAWAVFSPLRSNAWLHTAQGTLIGEIHVPRGLRDIVSLGFGSSRRLVVRNAFQETLTLGSPNAVAPFETILSGKREGAAFLPDGSGLAVQRSKEGRIDLIVLRQDAASGRSTVVRRMEVAANATSARIVGATGQIVCIRVEHVASNPEVQVTREAICLQGDTGQHTLHTSLPAPGVYVPRTEFALGGSPPRLVMLHPESEGLSVVALDPEATASEERAP